MDSNMVNIVQKVFSSIDEMWIKRKRILNTMSVVNILHQCAIRRRGLQHVLMCTNDMTTGVSAAAVCKARQKIPVGVFKKAMQSIQRRNNLPNIYAIDGSKVHVSPILATQGFKSRTNNKQVSRPAKRPICMLSSIVNVKTGCCLDFRVTKHFNERKAAIKLFESVNPNDVLLFDRGYFSKEMVNQMNERGINFVMRLKCDAFKGVKQFLNNNKLTKNVMVSSVKCRLVKYTISGKKYVCLTSLSSNNKEIKDLYAMRWKVEQHFKRLKSYLHLDKTQSKTTKTLFQDFEIRIFLDTLSFYLFPSNNRQSQVVKLESIFDFLIKFNFVAITTQSLFYRSNRHRSRFRLVNDITSSGHM